MVKLSIITVNYNNVHGLERTIKSVMTQQAKDIEFIVIDGKSTDDSVALLEGHDEHISYWSSEPDNGVYDAMNKGIATATGTYVLFLNSGDHFHNDTSAATMLPHLDGHDLIAFDIQVKGDGTDYVKAHPDVLQFSYLYHKTLAHQSVCIKRTLFDTSGGYDTSLRITADWKFFLDALVRKQCSYKAVHTVVSVYYLDGMSATAQGTNIRKQERKKVLAEEYGFFLKDYRKLEQFQLHRFKMLAALEASGPGRKVVSAVLRVLLFLFTGKKLRDLK
ncbi:glycosyltransferase family 2 protein [Altibacter sp.]|uniref:glycosyltransferase family 2 protein n=1 Tax=Altibacter sp. TaxID=2024823 RepID=UPI000C91BE95|nr:glycosyltransferase family 2 protein [Altibacter sp.]MAP54814.1 glycosyl transferase [Altibacter sp.]